MITEKQINKLTDVIVAETKPAKIYLFGSYAKSGAGENSDVDLLIIVDEEMTKENRRDKVVKLGLKTASEDLFFPKDFRIYSLTEFENLKNKKHSFLHHILNHAKPLYAR